MRVHNLLPIILNLTLKLLLSGMLLNTSQLKANDDLFQTNEEQATHIRPTDVIRWQVDQAESFKDGSVVVSLRLETTQDFSIYTDKLHFESSSGYLFTELKHPNTKEIYDPISNKQVSVHTNGEFFLLFSGLDIYEENSFPIAIKFVGCTSSICLFPYTQQLEIPNFVSKLGSSPLFKKKENPELDFEQEVVKQLEEGKFSIFWLLLLIFIGGLLTNLTPCVYPMIPITIRLLAGKSDKPVQGAIFYALGIMLTYTSLGIFAAFTGSMFGNIMATTGFSLSFAFIMFMLALGMLGYGHFGFLQGLGQKIGSEQTGYKKAFLMGAGAGLVASPCTGPILAALLAYSTKNNDPIFSSVLLFVYSFGFSIPYIFLGSAASRITQISVPAKIQVSVKLVFAAVLFSLSFYYLRIPFYQIIKSLIELWGKISLITLLTGCALSLAFLSKKEWYHKKSLSLVPAFLIGTGIFFASQWLTKPRNSKENQSLKWIYDEQEALSLASKSKSPLLIDAWAEWCEACKKMDHTTFTNPELIQTLINSNWILLKLDLTESNEKNDKLQEKYKILGLPTLLVIPNTMEPEKVKSNAGFIDSKTLLRLIKEVNSKQE